MFVLLLLFGAPASPSAAQNSTNQPLSPAPYRVGERLTYNVSFSNFNTAAHVELLVAARGTFFGREGIQLKGHVETTGMVHAALFAINNDYITYVDPVSGSPYYSRQIVRTASRTSESSADFNQPAGTAAPPKGTAQFFGNHDFLSAVYRVRALPLTEGTTYTLAVRDEKEIYEIEIRVRGRSVVKTSVGSFDTVMAQIKVRNNSRADDLGIRVYFSDDQRHVPVLITAKPSAGEIRAELAGSEFIATPPVPPAPGPSPVPASPAPPPTGNPTVSAGNETSLTGLPFRVGEQLNYQVFLPSIPSAAARATFQVRARSKYFNKDGVLFELNASTTNALQNIFFASDQIKSYADPKTLLPFQTEMNLAEGRRRSNIKLTINQDYGTATTEKGDRIEIPVGTHDYLSFFYALRTLNLVPPRRSAVSILVNNKPKTLFISALKREPLQLGSQTISAIQVSLTTDDPEADKYQLRVWLSDDDRRLPLRITAVTKLGAVRADLAIIPVATR
ncbi:MAG: DUF3108 domain-containing protein [Acidobacteriota bacterium]|nr:DUF3108 domain-containing protein [Acidobacteriota bacterium]